jgi:hypothetical protein
MVASIVGSLLIELLIRGQSLSVGAGVAARATVDVAGTANVTTLSAKAAAIERFNDEVFDFTCLLTF